MRAVIKYSRERFICVYFCIELAKLGIARCHFTFVYSINNILTKSSFSYNFNKRGDFIDSLALATIDDMLLFNVIFFRCLYFTYFVTRIFL